MWVGVWVWTCQGGEGSWPAVILSPPRPAVPMLQALLSRGDRRLSRLLLLVRQYGDSLGSFRRAFKELQGELPPMEHYVSTHYDPEEAGE